MVNGASDENLYKAEIENLQRIIGKQAIQIEILKKRRSYWEKDKAVGMLKRAGYTISDAYWAFRISRSSYYYLRKQKSRDQKEDIRDDGILEKIRELKTDHPFWGYRRVWAWLRLSGGSLGQSEEDKKIDEGEWADGDSEDSEGETDFLKK
ncbi:MAG: hypothetical protein NZ583_08240 [Desulfobacterota bacterium]|nr:hypothetical protein [Thermodesulfobacteriota bacterium]MDW8002775.1 hypothetical protein [Deltaproteobacteria bacterium]